MTRSIFSVGTSCVVGLIVLVGLGIYRLEVGRVPADVGALSAVAVDECLPNVELSTTTAVTVGSFASFDKEASLPAQGQTAAQVKSSFSFTATTPVEVRLKGVAAAEGASVPLKGQTITLKKGVGTFEMAVRGDDTLVHQGNALLRVPKGVRFGPTDDAIYEIQGSEDSADAAVVSSGKLIVPAGARLGSASLDSMVTAMPLQPVRVRVWLKNPEPSLSLLRISGQPGLSDIAIETGGSNLRFAQGQAVAYACVLAPKSGSKWVPAAVTQQPGGAGSTGRMSIALPSDALPPDASGITPLWIAVASADGQGIAIGGIQFVGRLRAGFIATVITLLLLGPLMMYRGRRVSKDDEAPRWFAGLFIGPDGDPSLSLLQILIWTTITIWGFFYVFIVAGNLLALTPEMMSLLGIAGVGTVVSRWINTSNSAVITTAGSTRKDADNEQAGNDFWRMLSTSGHFDLLKLQLFAFTVVIALYVVWRIADAAAFPVLDTNTLLLLGVSQGVYVTGKLASTNDLSSLQSAKALLDVKSEQLDKATADKSALDAKLVDLQAKIPRSPDDEKALSDQTTTAAQLVASLTSDKATLSASYDAALAKLNLKKA